MAAEYLSLDLYQIIYASLRSNQYDGPNNNWALERGTAPNFDYPYINDIETPSNNDKETYGASLELVWELDGFDVRFKITFILILRLKDLLCRSTT